MTKRTPLTTKEVVAFLDFLRDPRVKDCLPADPQGVFMKALTMRVLNDGDPEVCELLRSEMARAREAQREKRPDS